MGALISAGYAPAAVKGRAEGAQTRKRSENTAEKCAKKVVPWFPVIPTKKVPLRAGGDTARPLREYRDVETDAKKKKEPFEWGQLAVCLLEQV